MSTNVSRRDLLKSAAIGSAGIGVVALTGCTTKEACEQQQTATPDAGNPPDSAVPQSTAPAPDSLTAAEFQDSAVVLDPISSFVGEVAADIVVVGAGAAGVVAAITAAEKGSSVVVLQKQAFVVSQGNVGSGLILEQSDPEALQRFVHHTNSLNNWRSDPEHLKAYAMNSGEAVKWLYDRARLTGTTAQAPNDKGMFVYLDTSADFTGEWTDNRYCKFDYGKFKAHLYAPWMGPKPNNVGTFLAYVLDEAVAEFSGRLKVYFSTPGVQLIKKSDKVVGAVGKLQRKLRQVHRQQGRYPGDRRLPEQRLHGETLVPRRE
jgi:fumarate reductase flavoprotein subunit